MSAARPGSVRTASRYAAGVAGGAARGLEERLRFAADEPLDAADVRDVDRRARALDGVLGVERDADARIVVVSFDPARTRRELVRAGVESPFLRLAGAEPLGARLRAAFAPGRLERAVRAVREAENRRAIGLVGLTLAAALVGAIVQATAGTVAALPLWAVAYVAGGLEATLKTVRSLRERELDVDLLMLLAAAGAAIVGAFWEGAVLLFLFSLGGVLEEFALGRTHRSIRALMDLRPETVRVRGEDGEERVVPAGEVGPGAIAVVHPGERVPVDGVVVEGACAVDQSAITGESLPLPRAPGDRVLAGSIAQDGYVAVRVERPADQTVLARVIHLVEEAREQRAPAQRTLDRYRPLYVIAVLGTSAVAFLALLALRGHSPGDAFLQAMTLLVVASPCALVISVPATLLSAIANAARSGVLVKGSAPLEALAGLRVVAFDKTGTLTRGAPAVHEVVPVGGRDEADVLGLAAALEGRSEHPIARAVLAAAAARGIDPPEPESFAAQPGRGVEGTVAGVPTLVGSPGWLAAEGVDLAPLAAALARLDDATLLVVAHGGATVGVVAVADAARPEANEAVRRLGALGIETVMLSGDRPAVAARVGAALGIARVEAGLLPEDKVERIRGLHAAGPVAMVGDGVNDAPALANATVGIAMGAAGSDQSRSRPRTSCS